MKVTENEIRKAIRKQQLVDRLEQIRSRSCWQDVIASFIKPKYEVREKPELYWFDCGRCGFSGIGTTKLLAKSSRHSSNYKLRLQHYVSKELGYHSIIFPKAAGDQFTQLTVNDGYRSTFRRIYYKFTPARLTLTKGEAGDGVVCAVQN